MKPAALTVLWTGTGALAIDKPAGLAAIPGRAETDSVLERVAQQLSLPFTGENDPRVRVVHRLDKDTTGVMLFATDRATQQHFSHQFQNNTIQKEYLAIVRGKPLEQSGEIDAPLAPHPASPKRMAVVKRGGRPARTAWRVEESFRGFALLRCFPKTGKTHQIRVHLAHIGLPLAIDPLYGAMGGGSKGGILLSEFKRGYRVSRGQEERPLIDRLTLHAERLTFLDLGGASVTVESPPPKDFRAVLSQLRRNAR